MNAPVNRPLVQQFAGHYTKNQGWGVVPLPPNGKECLAKDWPNRTFGVDAFGPNSNIGIRSVNGLVVLDDDFDEPAVECADALLIPTDAVWGRPSKPRSKRLYLCPELAATVTFTDINGAHLVQLRVSLQDMAPPSVHPNGEQLRWDGLLKPPREIDAMHLEFRTRFYWTARLIAKYWPKRSRHDLRLAYAGFLLGVLDIHKDDVTRILHWACRLGGSDDKGVADVVAAVEGTRTKLDAHEPTTGAPTIAKLLPDTGARITRLLRKAYGKQDAVADGIDELNAKHALVFLQSGSTVLVTEDTEDGKPHLRFSKPSEMTMLYPQVLQVGKKAKPLGAMWLQHPNRRFYNGLELAPNGSRNANYFNIWRGFTVEPKRGEWPLFREQLNLVAGGNPDHARYIKKWMAETVQQPDRRIGIALAFRGLQGSGKSSFAIKFGELFGRHFQHLDSEQHLLGRFNAHLAEAIVVLADEAVWAGGKAGLGALKRMITEPTLNIEKKGIDLITVKNMLHMIAASNDEWVVPAGFDDRRFAIFDTDPKRLRDSKFFAAVEQELNNGGLAALLYDLLEFHDDIDLKDIPETTARTEQKEMTADVKFQWWFDVLTEGTWWWELRPDGLAEGEVAVPRETVFGSYVAACKVVSRGRTDGLMGHLGRFLRKVLPPGYPREVRTSSAKDRRRMWVFPSLDNCREAFKKANRGAEFADEAGVGEVSLPWQE